MVFSAPLFEHIEVQSKVNIHTKTLITAVQVEGSEERYRENYDTLLEIEAVLGPYHFTSH